MARFSGDVGYGIQEETTPGVWEEKIVRRHYYGDVQRFQRSLQPGEKILPDVNVNNAISIVADAFARDNFFAMRFVEWSGVCWIVTNVEVRYPRLILNVGGVYNGPKN